MSQAPPPRDARYTSIRSVLLVEGLMNLLVLAGKLSVGIATQSSAILSEALHSLTDLANNVLALMVIHVSSAPPDREHPYGHRKFEFLAVFVLAMLLCVMGVEIVLHAIDRVGRDVALSDWGLAVMAGVLVVNIGVAAWQNHWAVRLQSPLLKADARHTVGDVLMTAVVIVGWQLAARGYPVLDLVFALGVTGLVLYLAYGLFKRAIPILVDTAVVDDRELTSSIQAVPGVRHTARVRSRATGTDTVADVVISVDPELSAEAAHRIADAVEQRLAEEFGIDDVMVHIEPHEPRRRR